MANVLPFNRRVEIIAHLLDDASIRGAARLCGVDKETVMRWGVIIGRGCLALHDRIVRAVRMLLGEADEVWAYVGRHQLRLRPSDPPDWGDAYTMFAIDAVSKLVVSFLTGPRDLATATAFMRDLRARVVGKPQVSVDGWPIWPLAVREAFGKDGCDLGRVVKVYQREARFDEAARWHNPGRVKSMEKSRIFGEPDMKKVSTSIAERANGTTRMHVRRLVRLTNAFSRKRENLVAAIGLHFAWYNLVHVHGTIGTTAAVAARIVRAPWSLGQLVQAALDAAPPMEDVGDMEDDGPPTERDPEPWRGE